MPFNFGLAIFFFAVALLLFLPAFLVFRHRARKFTRETAAAREKFLAAQADEPARYRREWVDPANESLNVKRGAAGILVALLLLGGAFTFFASANTVEIRNVGIVTSFKKPTGETTGSGFHLVKPWEKLSDWDASIQTSEQTGGGFTDPNKNDSCTGSTLVRIGSMATACVENKIRWRVMDAAAPQQFFDYKGDFDAFKANYFETEKQNALNEVFASYNPLATFNAKVGQPEFDLAAKEKELKDALNRRLAGQITVESISIPLIHHDAKTEAQIKAQQDLIAKGRNLDQEKTNADKQKLVTNVKGQTSPVQQCLDNNKELGLSGGPCLQPGFPSLTGK